MILGAILLGIGAVIALTLSQNHKEIESSQRERLAVQAKIVDEAISNRLEAIYKTLAAIRQDEMGWTSESRRRAASRSLQTLGDAMLGVRTLTILDGKGTVIVSNRPQLIGRDATALSVYRLARGGGDLALMYVSPPGMTPLGTFAINIGRVALDSKGAFAGVVSATLDPEYFAALLDTVRYSPDGRFIMHLSKWGIGMTRVNVS